MSLFRLRPESAPGQEARRARAGVWRLPIIGSLLLTLTLSACSVLRLAYDQAPRLVQWRLERDLALDSQQSALAQRAVQDWFAWHRHSELPAYAARLEDAAVRVAGPLAPQQMCQWWDQALQAGERALDQAVPGLAQLAVTLTPRQIERLAQRQQDELADLRERYQGEQAQQARTDRIIGRMERLYGRLSTEQRTQVAALVAARPWDDSHWLDRRERRIDTLVGTLEQLRDADAQQATQALQPIVQDALPTAQINPQRLPVAAVADRTAARAAPPDERLSACQWAAELHAVTTDEQRQAAGRRLSGWAADLRRLSGT